MSSTFSCYNIARTGMYTSQRSLEVIVHNVTNADTVGYVRQQAMLSDKASQRYGSKQVGTGVSVSELRQIRSIFLDNTYRQENSTKSFWQNIQSTVEDIESILDSLSDTSGLGLAMDEFFKGWEELAKEPENGTAREAVVEYGNSFAEVMNDIEEQLDQIQESLDEQITSAVSTVNTIAGQIAELNKVILTNEINGQNANDYRDQRNALLDTLSGYTEIAVKELEDGTVRVAIGGKSIVNGIDSYHLSCEAQTHDSDFVTVVWENSGLEANLTDGSIAALIECRGQADAGAILESGTTEADIDNDAAAYSFSTSTITEGLIPRIREGLNIMVNLMARKINVLHESGIGLDGSTGTAFFVKLDESLPFQAGNIAVNPELEDASKIAASGTGAAGDATIADSIVDIRASEYYNCDSLKMNIDDFHIAVVDWIGTMGEEADTYVVNQGTLVEQADNNRLSLSQVSMDEELTNLIKYQHSYTASAKVMTTIDSMLDKIINGMGIAGR